MNLPLILTLVVPIVLVLCLYGQKKIDTSETTMVNLDLFRFIFSILIILMHGEFIINISVDTHFVINDVLVRVAVPFFFIVSGYIVSIKSVNNKEYETTYIKGIMKNYTFWFLLYIPIALFSLVEYKDLVTNVLSTLTIGSFQLVYLVPLGLVIAYFYMGSYYHLWYYPATFLSLGIVRYWNRKQWNIKNLLFIGFILFLFGLTESYFGILPVGIKPFVAGYFSILYTTRNFLFFGLFYITLGYIMGRMDLKRIKYSVYKLAFFFILLILESYLINDIDRYTLNFLFMAFPVSFYLVISLLHLPKMISTSMGYKLRGMSKYIYLTHPAIILVFVMMGIREGSPVLFGVLIIFFSLLVSYILNKKK